MTISPTGNKRKKLYVGQRGNGGFSFIEVMLAAIILAAGLVALYRSFMVGADFINYYASRLCAFNLLEDRIAAIEHDFQALKKNFDVGPSMEEVVINNRPVEFHYDIILKPVDKLLSVFQLDIQVSWQEKGRRAALFRSAYFSGLGSLPGEGIGP
jgi:hypothetical protein